MLVRWLHIIAGVDRPTSGQCLVGGVEVTSLNESELADWRSHLPRRVDVLQLRVEHEKSVSACRAGPGEIKRGDRIGRPRANGTDRHLGRRRGDNDVTV